MRVARRAGGVASGVDAVELLMAGASAVQVGTATFADPRAPEKVLSELARWCRRHKVGAVAELVGAAHRVRAEQGEPTGLQTEKEQHD